MFIVALFVRTKKPEMQMSINKKMGKQTVVHSYYNEILFSNKKNEPLIYTIIYTNLKNIILNKVKSQEHILYDSIFIKF